MSNLLVTFTNSDTHKHGGQLWLSQKFETAWQVLEEIECILRHVGSKDIQRSGAQALTAINLFKLGYDPFLNDLAGGLAALVANDETYSILEFESDTVDIGCNVCIKLHAGTTVYPVKCFHQDKFDDWIAAHAYMREVKADWRRGLTQF